MLANERRVAREADECAHPEDRLCDFRLLLQRLQNADGLLQQTRVRKMKLDGEAIEKGSRTSSVDARWRDLTSVFNSDTADMAVGLDTLSPVYLRLYSELYSPSFQRVAHNKAQQRIGAAVAGQPTRPRDAARTGPLTNTRKQRARRRR